MSLDETKLISNVLKSTVSFDNALQRAKMDGVIDEEEKTELDSLRAKIFEEAASIAEEDETVTEEESKLLNKLMEIIISLKDQYE